MPPPLSERERERERERGHRERSSAVAATAREAPSLPQRHHQPYEGDLCAVINRGREPHPVSSIRRRETNELSSTAACRPRSAAGRPTRRRRPREIGAVTTKGVPRRRRHERVDPRRRRQRRGDPLRCRRPRAQERGDPPSAPPWRTRCQISMHNCFLIIQVKRKEGKEGSGRESLLP